MFQFKQFSVKQDKCAMKVGTDGVLLGAWTPIQSNPRSILDIGSGTGIIALMLAQRSNAMQIDALEIDADAYEQTVENFEESPWGDRLFCYHASLDEFTEEIQGEETYDLIVSNPPFYTEDFTTNNIQRNIARFSSAMPFEDLLESVSLLLADKGIFCVIIPYKEEPVIIELAEKFKLYPFKITHVQGMLDSSVKRSLIAFSAINTEIEITRLIIETGRHHYTPEYIALTQDFYLKM